jgi:hypothetical protein
MSPGAAAGWHRCAAAPWPCGPVRRPGPQDGGRSKLQCCNRSRRSAGRRCCRAGGTGGGCWAMAKSPGVAVRRDHHLVGDPIRRSSLKRGDRGQERAAVLQPLEVPRWPAAPASPWWCEIRSGWRAAGPWRWPCPRTGRQTEAITWWAARSAAWFPGARCSAATARGTPLAGSPGLSLVVRDQIRWACCGTMAKCPGGTADRAITWWATRSGGLAPWDG